MWRAAGAGAARAAAVAGWLGRGLATAKPKPKPKARLGGGKVGNPSAKAMAAAAGHRVDDYDGLSRMGDLIDEDVINSHLAQGSGTLAGDLQTIGDVFRFAVTEFSRPEARLSFGQGSVDAEEEAHLLLLLHLNLPLSSTASFFSKWSSSRLTAGEVQALRSLIAKRVSDKIPVAYLCRACFQQGERFFVDERALIPRSHLAELLSHQSSHFLFRPAAAAAAKRSKKAQSAAAAALSQSLSLPAVRSVLDLCTGSGVLAVLAYRMLARGDRQATSDYLQLLPQQQQLQRTLRVDAVDISAAALQVAEKNVRDKKLQDHISFFCGDLFDALPAAGPGGDQGRYDLIVSNPPYVEQRAMDALPAEYRREPALALAGGGDGLEVVRRIIAGSAERLSAHGRLVLECGASGRHLGAAVSAAGGRWVKTSNSEGEVLLLSRDECEAVAARLT